MRLIPAELLATHVFTLSVRNNLVNEIYDATMDSGQHCRCPACHALTRCSTGRATSLADWGVFSHQEEHHFCEAMSSQNLNDGLDLQST